MLSNIYIKNFAIIDEKTIPFTDGFNVLSGETGAGKSILIDALGLQLGDRADNSWIRHGKPRCEIQSDYQLSADNTVYQWLSDNEFNEEQCCQLRRTLSTNGKSRCYINGIPTTLGNTKILGEMLVDIHGQHAHQSLTSPDKQLALLDNFAQHHALVADVKKAYQHWQTLQNKQRHLHDDDSNLHDKYDLMRYQLEELHEANLVADEFEQLSEEQKRLSASSEILQYCQQMETTLNEHPNLCGQVQQLLQLSEKINQLDPRFEETGELLNQALIYLEETHASLNHYQRALDIDPEVLNHVESRMSLLYDLARKHRVEPNALPSLETTLSKGLQTLEETIQQLSTLDADIATAKSTFDDLAEHLSQSRQKAAKQLIQRVNHYLGELHLAEATFNVVFDRSAPKANGVDRLLFMFAPNPGQGEKALHKIASGGELSRISLAIQVASVSNQTDTTLIFDEVDSGVGGATAEVVGQLLKTLSQYHQIICVTHLAQVAAFADCHIKISKSVVDGETFTDFQSLNPSQRVDELARMSGGIKRDKKTQQHAQNLLDNAVQFNLSLK